MIMAEALHSDGLGQGYHAICDVDEPEAQSALAGLFVPSGGRRSQCCIDSHLATADTCNFSNSAERVDVDVGITGINEPGFGQCRFRTFTFASVTVAIAVVVMIATGSVEQQRRRSGNHGCRT